MDGALAAPRRFGANEAGRALASAREQALATKQDLVLGAVGGRGWDQIELWAHSLANRGFKGMVAVIVYGDNQQVIENLQDM